MGPRLLFGALSSALLVVSCGKTDIAPAIEWNDLATGERKARRTGKPAVIFVFATWSTADVELDRVTFASPEVRAAMRDFIAIKIDASDDENKETQLATSRFDVKGVPTIIVLDDFNRYPSANQDYPRANPYDLYRSFSFVPPNDLAISLRAAKRDHDSRTTKPRSP
jgi:hypothetical protein